MNKDTKNLEPLQFPIAYDPNDFVPVSKVKTEADTDESMILQSYKRLATAWHVAKAGGTSSHTGSFQSCKNKVCSEHRRILESVK